MTDIFTIENLIALLTLTVLEVVLGIDNIVFISVLTDKVPAKQQDRARSLGLAFALITRVALLFSLSWLNQLDHPIFALWGFDVSGHTLILLAGGLFLLYKSTHEIHDKLEGKEGAQVGRARATLAGVIIQIGLLDIVFSLDSVITAVGMARELWVMVAAIVIAIGIMMFAAGPISSFVNRHPTIKILALSFLLLIGTSLVIEALHIEIPKGYIYFAMGFSVFVEMLNLRMRSHQGKPVQLREAYAAVEGKAPARARSWTRKGRK
jgi:predicted tellurium resistance membrane protein TerC